MDFIANLEKAKRTGWAENNTHTDVRRLCEKQKVELKQAIEAGKDIVT